MKLAINGFGRIGRAILRQILTTPRGDGIEVVRINDIAPLDMCAYLFQYDSTFGPFAHPVEHGGGALQVMGRSIPVSHEPDLTSVDLSGVDLVLECTGIARTSDVAERGLKAGAGKVLISGPSPAAELTMVLGANEEALGDTRIVSNASLIRSTCWAEAASCSDAWSRSYVRTSASVSASSSASRSLGISVTARRPSIRLAKSSRLMSTSLHA
jgi:glyceraldehyde-3-phosphate dehydrogenase/erythrose-4-phosphate dehydrogenase